jgi:hypothetical protein
VWPIIEVGVRLVGGVGKELVEDIEKAREGPA